MKQRTKYFHLLQRRKEELESLSDENCPAANHFALEPYIQPVTTNGSVHDGIFETLIPGRSKDQPEETLKMTIKALELSDSSSSGINSNQISADTSSVLHTSSSIMHEPMEVDNQTADSNIDDDLNVIDVSDDDSDLDDFVFSASKSLSVRAASDQSSTHNGSITEDSNNLFVFNNESAIDFFSAAADKASFKAIPDDAKNQPVPSIERLNHNSQPKNIKYDPLMDILDQPAEESEVIAETLSNYKLRLQESKMEEKKSDSLSLPSTTRSHEIDSGVALQHGEPKKLSSFMALSETDRSNTCKNISFINSLDLIRKEREQLSQKHYFNLLFDAFESDKAPIKSSVLEMNFNNLRRKVSVDGSTTSKSLNSSTNHTGADNNIVDNTTNNSFAPTILPVTSSTKNISLAVNSTESGNPLPPHKAAGGGHGNVLPLQINNSELTLPTDLNVPRHRFEEAIEDTQQPSIREIAKIEKKKYVDDNAQSLLGTGRGRGATLPAWVTNPELDLQQRRSDVNIPNHRLGDLVLDTGMEEKATEKLNNNPVVAPPKSPTGAGRGRTATLPAWVTNPKLNPQLQQRRSDVNIPNHRLGDLVLDTGMEEKATEKLNNNLVFAPPKSPTGAGRGRTATLPAWMTNSELNPQLQQQQYDVRHVTLPQNGFAKLGEMIQEDIRDDRLGKKGTINEEKHVKDATRSVAISSDDTARDNRKLPIKELNEMIKMPFPTSPTGSKNQGLQPSKSERSSNEINTLTRRNDDFHARDSYLNRSTETRGDDKYNSNDFSRQMSSSRSRSRSRSPRDYSSTYMGQIDRSRDRDRREREEKDRREKEKEQEREKERVREREREREREEERRKERERFERAKKEREENARREQKRREREEREKENQREEKERATRLQDKLNAENFQKMRKEQMLDFFLGPEDDDVDDNLSASTLNTSNDISKTKFDNNRSSNPEIKQSNKPEIPIYPPNGEMYILPNHQMIVKYHPSVVGHTAPLSSSSASAFDHDPEQDPDLSSRITFNSIKILQLLQPELELVIKLNQQFFQNYVKGLLVTLKKPASELSRQPYLLEDIITRTSFDTKSSRPIVERKIILRRLVNRMEEAERREVTLNEVDDKQLDYTEYLLFTKHMTDRSKAILDDFTISRRINNATYVRDYLKIIKK